MGGRVRLFDFVFWGEWALGAAVAELGEFALDVGLGAEPLDGEEEAGVGASHLMEGQ